MNRRSLLRFLALAPVAAPAAIVAARAAAPAGPVPYAGLDWCGERGPEIVYLPGGSQVIPNQISRTALYDEIHVTTDSNLNAVRQLRTK